MDYKSAVEWFIQEFEKEPTKVNLDRLFDQAKEIEKQQQGYNDEEMKSFAEWCRNGLLNSEYSVDRLNEHLEQWNQFKKK